MERVTGCTGFQWDEGNSAKISERHKVSPSECEESFFNIPLIVADAGFVGYETWKTLLESGRHLLVRVGANVRLL